MSTPSVPAANESGAGFRRSQLLWISLLFCSTGIAEATSNFIMPDTIHRFTQNAFYISVVLSFNPLFGFVAQPLAGWYSDRIWTPLGRRLPLIIGSAALLALSCLGLPHAQAQADRLGWVGQVIRWCGAEGVSPGLALLACWILLYQFVVDVISIMVRCLIADMVPARLRATAFGAAQVVSTAMIFGTLWWGGTIARNGEWKWYALTAAIALAAVVPAAFFLREPAAPTSRGSVASSGSWRDYWRAVRETPHFPRMCLVIALTFVAGQLILNYYRLFTKEQLQLDLPTALRPFSWMPVIAFFASFPVGWLADRWSLKYMTQAGCLLVAAAGLVGALADSVGDLRVMAILMGLGFVAMDIASNAYLISFIPAEKMGQLSGFANVFRGGPRFLMFFGAGGLIELCGRNYRLAFWGAVVASLGALVLLATLPHRRPPTGQPGGAD